MSVNLLRLVAILLLCGAVLLGWYGYQMGKPRVSVEVTTAAPPATSMRVVAAQKILPGQIITAAQLAEVAAPAIETSGFEHLDQVVGKVAEGEVAAGSVLTIADFRQYGPAAQQLLAGERAVAVKLDEVAGVGGYIKPGDHVDVLFFANDDSGTGRHSVSRVVLSDLRVVSVGDDLQQSGKDMAAQPESVLLPKAGQTGGADKPNPGIRSAVLAVPEPDVTTLMLAANMGVLRFALRGAHTSAVPAAATAQHTVQHNHYLIRSEALLTPGDTAPVVHQSAVAAAPGRGQVKAGARTPLKQVIVHDGDRTRTVLIKDGK